MEVDLSKFRILSYGGTGEKDGNTWTPVPCSTYLFMDYRANYLVLKGTSGATAYDVWILYTK